MDHNKEKSEKKKLINEMFDNKSHKKNNMWKLKKINYVDFKFTIDKDDADEKQK